MGDTKPIHVTRLILVPTLITLAVTIVRFVGEIKHWPAPFFNNAGGGGGAIVGIVWLPIIFGPYFALKLMAAGEAPASPGKVIGFALGGVVVFIAGGALFAKTLERPSLLTVVALLLFLGAGFVPRHPWVGLGNVLLAYAFAARVPVVIVMYYAMSGNGGAGFGTHYDAVPPAMAHLPLAKRFFDAAILPQFTLWISWTVIVGMIFGAIAVLVARRGKQTASASA